MLSPLQQTPIENVVAIEETAYYEQFLLLTLCFQLDSIFILSFIEINIIFAKIFSKSSATDLFYMGKVLIQV